MWEKTESLLCGTGIARVVIVSKMVSERPGAGPQNLRRSLAVGVWIVRSSKVHHKKKLSPFKLSVGYRPRCITRMLWGSEVTLMDGSLDR